LAAPWVRRREEGEALAGIEGGWNFMMCLEFYKLYKLLRLIDTSVYSNTIKENINLVCQYIKLK